ncbi:MAG: hypothetical protein AAFN59_07400 [Pseudomonadota bacterium]
MVDERSKPVDLGIYTRQDTEEGLSAPEKIALGLSLFWLIMAGLFFVILPSEGRDPLRLVMVIMAVLLPVGLIWVAALAARSAQVMREESERLQVSMDAIRQIYVSQAKMAGSAVPPGLERKLDDIAKAQKMTEATLAAALAPPPQAPSAPAAPQPNQPVSEQQPSLALGQSPRAVQVSRDDLIVALNFPETADDVEGFRALRRALADPRLSRLIRASQDVLTLLSEDGIYMDDMAPDRSRPELWRRFFNGERGRTISALGGIRDRSSLALTAARLKQDPIFKDAAHHFLRSFDHTLAALEEGLSDADIVRLVDTRSARAFMLIGRVAGSFN